MPKNESPQMMMRSGDGYNVVQFKWLQRRNNAISEREGRPIYDNVLMAFVSSPKAAKNQMATVELERHVWTGDDSEPEVIKRHDKLAIYGELLDKWRDNGGGGEVGTPLDAISLLDAPQIASLNEMGITTVEELASIPDSGLFMGGRKWRDMAKAYLEQAQGQKPLSDLIARNESLETEVEHLRKQIEELTARFGNGPEEPVRRRGRPRKVG